jgi:hypothetical protein
VVELRLRVEVPEPVTLMGLKVAVSPVDGDTVAVRLTAPLKPWSPVTVTVLLLVPTFVGMVTEAGLGAIVKSCTVKEGVVE